MTRQPNLEFLRRAIALATENVNSGRGGPFAALIARDGKIVAEGLNIVTSTNDPTAHGEVTAIRAACKTLGSFCWPGANSTPVASLARCVWRRLTGRGWMRCISARPPPTRRRPALTTPISTRSSARTQPSDLCRPRNSFAMRRGPALRRGSLRPIKSRIDWLESTEPKQFPSHATGT